MKALVDASQLDVKALEKGQGLLAVVHAGGADAVVITGGDDALDTTWIHPESYPVAEKLLANGVMMAVAEINAAGGIKALGGAKMKLVVVDAGDKVETARNAAERMLSQNPNLSGATGAWLSSFTLAVTEVTERAQLPMLTLSFSGQITSRGFKYIFQCSPTGDEQAIKTLPVLLDLAQRNPIVDAKVLQPAKHAIIIAVGTH